MPLVLCYGIIAVLFGACGLGKRTDESAAQRSDRGSATVVSNPPLLEGEQASLSARYRQRLGIQYGTYFQEGVLDIRGSESRYHFATYPKEAFQPPVEKTASVQFQAMMDGDPNGLAMYSSSALSFVLSPQGEGCRVADCYVRDTIGRGTPQWVLIEGERLCGGKYVCREATSTWGGRAYTAQYLPAYPTDLGPYKFHGLPGLVYAVRSADGIVNIELTSFEKLEPEVTWSPPAYGRALSESEVRSRKFAQFIEFRNQGYDFLIEDPAPNTYIELDRPRYAEAFWRENGGR